MLILSAPNISAAEITDAALYTRRRTVLSGLGLAAAALFGIGPARAADLSFKHESLIPQEPTTPLDKITTYNNYYEFGTDKSSPAANARRLHTTPWTVTVDGECLKPTIIALEDLIKPDLLEERIYRHRCVEGWSMVIPWVGFPLSKILSRVEPTSNAKYVAFQTLMRPSEMPGENGFLLDWPYTEGLRLDEAMNDLTILAVGLYGQTLPNQNGAPLRLVVPWKYGFKGIKAIVRISLVRDPPLTTWNKLSPVEYGFYSNVNPNVDHPRWSQARERRIGEFSRRPTLMFNGYGDQVASLYTGMDLRKDF